MANEQEIGTLLGAGTGAAIGGPAGIGIGASLGGALGSIFGDGDDTSEEALAEQKRQYNEMVARLNVIGVPSIEAQKIILTDPQLVGELIPEMQEEAKQLASQMTNVQVDPRLKQAQMDSLVAIQERTTGLTPEDEIAIRKVREDISGQAASQDADIIRNLQQRGLGGAGAELAMRQANSQSAQRQAAEEADILAAMQYQARMQALDQAGSMAGNLRSQEYGEKSTQAQALDNMSKFNLANQMNVSQQNVNARNAAQAANLAQRQSLESARAGNRNQEEINNKGLQQTYFSNQIAKATGQNNMQAQMNAANMQAAQNQAANNAARTSGLTQAIMGGAQAYGNYQQRQDDNAYRNAVLNKKA